MGHRQCKRKKAEEAERKRIEAEKKRAHGGAEEEVEEEAKRQLEAGKAPIARAAQKLYGETGGPGRDRTGHARQRN